MLLHLISVTQIERKVLFQDRLGQIHKDKENRHKYKYARKKILKQNCLTVERGSLQSLIPSLSTQYNCLLEPNNI